MVDNRKTDGPPPREVHVEGEDNKGFNWLPLLLGALALLGLLFALNRCNRDDRSTVTNDSVTTTTSNEMSTGNIVGSTETVSPATAAGMSGLGDYLKGSDAAPQTFTFEKLNFDTAKSAVRPADKAELGQVAAMLKQYPNTHVRLVGYADARGNDASNRQLGQARADAVKSSLVSQGIAGTRIETGSGGEQPVDTNATAGGRAENRRTELVVTQR